MAKSRGKEDKKGESGWSKAAFLALHIADRAFDAFGVPMTVLFGLFGVVYAFGTSGTRDDFIRELLFRGITHTPWLQVFFVGLIAVAIVLAVKAQKRGRSLESGEMQRLADQKTELQEQLAGKLLSHSTPPSEEKAEL